MKIALLLTGFLRTRVENYSFLRGNVLDRYDVSVYCATWDNQEKGSVASERSFEIYKPYLKKSVIVDSEQYKATAQRFSYLDRENDVFKTDERAKVHGKFWADRLRDQWFIVKKGFELIEDSYDIVFRLRFDIKLMGIDIVSRPEVVIPKSAWDFTDHMAYGSYAQMKKYCSMYDHIFDMYRGHNVDISHAENMLKFYMEQYQEPVQKYTDHRIEYLIVK
jgi:hypothetical protein